MKKTTFRKFIIVSVSLFLTLGGVAWACGWWYDEDEVNYSMFSPEVIHNESYTPFFRTFHTLYKYEGTWNNVSDYNMVNLDEWYTFFENKVDTSDLNYLLYSVSLDDLEAMIRYTKKPSSPLPSTLKNNSILRYSNRNAAVEFMYYLDFAKRCEPFATFVEDDVWRSEATASSKSDDAAKNKLIQRGSKIMLSAKIPFIQQRYLFQIIRMYYHSGNNEGCIDFYNQHKADFTLNNSIKYRSIGYVAGALYRSKKYAEANYLFSLVYDNSPISRVSAYLGFHPVEEADWQGCLALAQSTHEKNVLWHLLGIYADPLRAMNEIYKTEPTSELLNLLLVRAVNIEEEKFVPLRYYEDGTMNDNALNFKKKDISQPLFNFIKKVADSGVSHKPCIWNLATGYFYIALGDYKKAEKYLDNAQKMSKADTLINKQIRLLQVVTLIEKTDKLDKAFESNILNDLLWLKTDSLPGLRNASAYEWALKRLAEKYAQNKNSIRAECLNCMHDIHYYDDTLKAAQMIQFMLKDNKTDFEKFIISVHPFKLSDIVDFQAIQLAYQNRFKEALAKYKKYNCDGGLLLGDPFMIHINDCHDCDHENASGEGYTKASFIERMIQLQQEVEQNKAGADKAAFLLANGYYNMTYFGNARAMYETNITGYVDYNPYYGYNYSQKALNSYSYIYDCSLSEYYYNKAISLSKSKEFKAQCCFMAAKCEQNAYFISENKAEGADFKAGKYFKLLKSDYAKTQYYKEIINECGYFRTFLNK